MAEKIHAIPSVDYAIVGGEVLYSVADSQRDVKEVESHEGRSKFIWSVTYGKNPKAPKGDDYDFNKWQPDLPEATKKWEYSGTHTVWCVIKPARGDTSRILKRTQKVITSQQALSQALAHPRQTHEPPHPVTTWQHTVTYIAKLEAMHEAERKRSRSSGERRKGYDYGIFEAKLAKYKKYRDALRKLCDKYLQQGASFYPFYAAHVNLETHETRMLHVCVVVYTGGEINWLKPKGARLKKLAILDWTNPEDEHATKAGQGTGATFKEALKNALAEWDETCSYFPGWVKYTIPRSVPGGFIAKKFETGEKTTFATVAEWLGWSSMSLGVIQMFAGLLIPEASLVAIIIMTALRAGTVGTSVASAVFSIADRHRRDAADWRADLFDGLSILSSMFEGARGAWKRGATVYGRLPGGKKAETYLFVGQLLTDGFQGVLITSDAYEDLHSTMNDTALAPDERYRRGLKMAREATRDLSLTFVAMLGTHAEFKAAGVDDFDPSRLRRLIDTEETIHLDADQVLEAEGRLDAKARRNHPTYEGHGEPSESGVPATKPKTRKFPDALEPKKRGMRPADDHDFANLGHEKKQHIFVRDGNPPSHPYIGMEGYEAKPMDLKAKTAKHGPNAGLAVADPNDAGLKRMLRNDKAYAHLSSDEARYQAYVKDLARQGLWVHKDKHYLITRHFPEHKGFYSDYDLHGVYDATTGRLVSSKDTRMAMNKEVDGIQHPAHDEWTARSIPEKAHGNYGPQPPVTVYGPDGTAKRLETWKDMKAYANEHGLQLEDRYKDINWDLWQERRRAAGKSDDM